MIRVFLYLVYWILRGLMAALAFLMVLFVAATVGLAYLYEYVGEMAGQHDQ